MPFTESGVRVWIEVDGVPLPEYRVQVGQCRTTCFIPSQEGKTFCIRFQNAQPPASALRGNIFLDGIPAGAGVLLATDTHATSVSGQSRWEGLESPFQFARLNTTDDEDLACQDETRLRELGTVRVQIEWVNVFRQEPWRQPSNPASMSSRQPIHERTKKASTHCVSFGELQVSRPKNWYSTSRVPSTNPVDFVFQYASLDWLRAQDIIPTSSSASTSSHAEKRHHEANNGFEDTDFEILDEEEATVYLRLKAKLATGRNAKRRKTIKQDPESVPRTSLSNPPEVIDLTGDD